MKIKKFEQLNENLSLLTNEPWSREKFVKITNLKNEIESIEKDLLPLLKEYLLINPDIQDEDAEISEDETYITSYSFDPNSTEPLYFSYRPEDGDIDDWDVNLNKKQFEDLLEFLKNPEMYKNANKYNL